jgi:hypothetical protein
LKRIFVGVYVKEDTAKTEAFRQMDGQREAKRSEFLANIFEDMAQYQYLQAM